ncbi:DnaD domain protein [Ligilactobacillus ruminis]|nr:DnaD domain protein [Ligilactobacillus ruminis]
MAYFRVNKNRDYTVMSNHHLRDRNLSLRAIGLLSKMLSLPDDWDYSVPGLVAICQESKNIIQGALKELEKNGYLVRTMTRDSSGHIGYNYDVYEQPQHTLPRPEKPFTVEPCTVSPSTVEPCTEKQPQLNTKELNTERASTQEKAVEPNVVNIEDQQKQTTDCGGFAKVTQFYQDNFGMLSSYLYDDIRQTYNEWQQQSKEPDLIIIKAMQIALSNNVRNWKYACAVLRTWEDKRPQSLSDVEALEAEHKNNRTAKSKHAKPEKQKTMENFDDLANKQNAGIDMSETLSDIESLKNQLYG